MKDVAFRRRTNIKSLSVALVMSKTIVHRRVQDGNIRAHSNAVKPYLSDANKKARLELCLSMVDEGTSLHSHNLLTCIIEFISMKNGSINRRFLRYYIHPNEKEPSRTCKSKRFILKIMFLAAVARPIIDANRGE